MARQIGELYAAPLFELCCAEGIEEEAVNQLTQVSKLIFAQPEYVTLLTSPCVTQDEKHELVNKAFKGQVHEYILNLLMLLCDNNRMESLNEITAEFRQISDRNKGVLNVTAVTAKPLSDELKQKMQSRLSEKFKKDVVLNVEIDESLIGGVLLKTQGREIDATLKAKLAGIKNQIKNIAL